jgi:hypothetical protein
MQESGVVLDLKEQPIYWHTPADRTTGAIPDSHTLWEVLWENRENLSGFAHSHPGRGLPGPSYTDVTTFSSIERALGKKLNWWITSEDRVALVRWFGPGKHDYKALAVEDELVWVPRLRELSYP